jgi:GntR family transcriptional regulator
LTGTAVSRDTRHTPDVRQHPARPTLAAHVRDEIQALIEAGSLGSGAQLPPEAELSERYGVARTTVREALKLLEQDGLVDVVHGRGRYVSSIGALGVGRPVTRFESATAMLASAGIHVRNLVLRVERGAATAEEAEALALDAGAPVVRLERIRMSGDRPLIYSQNTLPAEAVDDGDGFDWSSSVVEQLARRGRAIASSLAEIRASALPEDAPRELDHSFPWLLIVERCLLADRRPVLYALDYHRGDVFSFDVVRRSTRGPGRSRSITVRPPSTQEVTT